MDKAAEKKALDKQKRLEAKMAKIRNGTAELEIWLCDLIRSGLMTLPDKPRRFWEEADKRMVDAQAAGLAASVKVLRDLDFSSGRHWQEEALATIARMWMTIKGLRNTGDMPENQLADLKVQLGIGPGPKEVLADTNAESLSDQWLAIGRQTEVIDDITTQRNWLYGCHSGRFALVMNFAFKKMPIESTIKPGAVHDAELVFFPSATPLRATIRQQGATAQNIPDILPGLEDWAAAEKMMAQRLTDNPWSDHFPLMINGIKAYQGTTGWGICDANNKVIPFHQGNSNLPLQQLLALSGGRTSPAFLLFRREQIQLLGIPHNGAYYLTT